MGVTDKNVFTKLIYKLFKKSTKKLTFKHEYKKIDSFSSNDSN